MLSLFPIDLPILQAPIGGLAVPALAAEVGRAGGMGSLAVTWMTAAEEKARIRDLKSKGFPFFVNFVLHFDVSHALALADEGVPAATFSWGCDRDLIRAFQERGSKVGVQTGSVEGAIAAREAGADFVIAQGIEAGGHVQSTTALATLLKGCIVALPGTPIVAAGGISTGEDIAAALSKGASAVMMGTRYIASRECPAHESYKTALVKAKPDDTVFTNCFDIDWPYAMHRVLRNRTFAQWEAAGCPASPNRPGEGDLIGKIGGKPVVRYCDMPPNDVFEGRAEEACLYAGTSVHGINAIEPAFDLTTRLWREAKAFLKPA